MYKWHYSQCHQTGSNQGMGNEQTSLNSTQQVRGRVQVSLLAQPHNHPISVFFHLWSYFPKVLNVKYILHYLPYNYAK